MAENPLLPDATLRALYQQMQRSRSLDRRTPAARFPREALLAPTLMQLEAGDLVCPQPGDPSPAALLSPGEDGPPDPKTHAAVAVSLPGDLRLPLLAGAAYRQRLEGKGRLTLAFLRAGTLEPAWAETLAWAQREQLPLLLACTDLTGPGRKRSGDTVSATTMSRLAQSLGLPVFPVDAADAVAVYRVMYESILRARAGGGPAVLWGSLANPRTFAAQPRTQPLQRLAAYMKARGIRQTA